MCCASRLSFCGKPVMEIVALTGPSWAGVRKRLDRYETGGVAALRPARRGRKAGTYRALSEEEERRILAIIRDKRPEELKIDFALWSRAAVTALIKQECGIELQVRSVGKYLARWGFTPQKPIRNVAPSRPAPTLPPRNTPHHQLPGPDQARPPPRINRTMADAYPLDSDLCEINQVDDGDDFPAVAAVDAKVTIESEAAAGFVQFGHANQAVMASEAGTLS